MYDDDARRIVPRYAPRLKATLIPEASPFDLPLKCIAVNERWLSHILGVMEALDQEDTWLGTEEEIRAARDAVNAIMAAWGDECEPCVTPTGDPPFRVRGDGEIEQLSGGEWTEPSGDYDIPEVPAREELTTEERKCLAARNAANVLEEIYEAVTDQYTEEVDPQLGILAILGAIGILFAFPFAPIVGGILLFLEVPFLIFYGAIEALGSDFWNAEFTSKLECVLLRNATDDAGVITFDFEQVITELSSDIDLFDPTVTEFRLFGQVDFMLRSIGADGLNHAGTTTAITEADCSMCAPETWGYVWTLTETDGDFINDVESAGASVGTWNTAAWVTTFYGAYCAGGDLYALQIRTPSFDVEVGSTITRLAMMPAVAGGNSCNHAEMFVGTDRTDGLGRSLSIYVNGAYGNPLEDIGEITEQTGLFLGVGINSFDNTGQLFGVAIEGTGTMPAFTGGASYTP